MTQLEIPRNWTFKEAGVAADFDRHVREQLPWYDLVTGAVAHIARHYVTEGGLVYDVGCSTGNVARALAETLAARNAAIVGVDDSAFMAAASVGMYETVHVKRAQDFAFSECDLIVCMLSLMFVPPHERPALLSRMHNALRPGGALVIVDRTEAAEGYVATVLWRLALAGKIAAGATGDEIVAKELSLAGVQRPLAWNELSPLMPSVEFFRFGDFAGWIAEKR